MQLDNLLLLIKGERDREATKVLKDIEIQQVIKEDDRQSTTNRKIRR